MDRNLSVNLAEQPEGGYTLTSNELPRTRDRGRFGGRGDGKSEGCLRRGARTV